MSDYQMTTLPNGVRIVSEQMAGFSSAALGIWVATGSRAETASENGAAHFIEHMLFTGTSRSTAEEIAQRMDAIGGQINAFTTKECTCFYARALKSHLSEALDILCEMFFDAKFAEEDVQLERGVILEEIGMYQDDPSDLVSERLNAAVYKGSPLARPILGKRSTLEKMTGQWLKDYKTTHYLPGTVIVALAGSFDESILDDIAARFSAMAPGPAKKLRPAVYHPAMTLKKKATEQNHLLLSFPSIQADSPQRFTMQLLSSILGGGMSSRLFQEIREQRGLCYSIYAAGSCYADTGMFLLYTALNRDAEAQALTAIREVVRRFTEDGVTQEELDRAREQAKASVLMGLEANTAHMNHLARNILNGTPIQTAEEIIASYDAITRQDVQDMARETFDWSQLGFSAVGRVAGEEQYRELLSM
ncbi:MAG: insulinase family protein [Clostridiales bacterium]|nr:insulinase family protein [Clostridiales bacterium]